MNLARLAIALFAVQAGFHGYTASLPLALARAGVPDPEIGVIMGVAALVQVPAALVGGRLVDRYGGVRLFVLGGVAYLAATAILLLPWVEPGASAGWLLAARTLQGMGIAATLPSALSLVPRMLPRERHGVGLAFVGAAHNLTLVVLPTLSIAVLNATSLHGVAAVVMAFIVAGMALVWRLPVRPVAVQEGVAAASRRLGITFRRPWLGPLLIVTLYVAHWGVVMTYLPSRAEAAGADVGLFFAADGIAILVMRVPSGWLADRLPTRLLVLAGASVTAVSLVLLFPPPTTPALVAAGFLGGAGGAIILTPILVELSRRSTDADRGSAFALFSAGLAAAMAIGSIGAAPIVGFAGFEVALAMGILLIVAAMALAVADRGLGARGRGIASEAAA